MAASPESVLKSIFGYDRFKPLQREVIESVLRKRDTLAVLPTGGGKSLCYQLPAMIFPGLTLVVSPLIALMKDQVDQMRALGVPALFLNSSLTPEDYQKNMAQVSSGKIKLLYLAPEALLSARLFSMLLPLPIDCLTIDEAHCISEWGHDFRPEYRQIADVRRRFPQAVCLALTATATARVRADIAQNLNLVTANQFVASFNRENLLLEVWPKKDPAAQTLHFLEDQKDKAGIIYCFSRKQVDELAYFLSGKGFKVRPYHAGLEDAERKRNQEAFSRDDIQIIVATIAFGMGINKSNVRFVLHYDLPKSVEGYYQEIGRAGRDGLPARCLLLYSYGDVAKLKYFIDQKEEAEQKVAISHLEILVKYAENSNCRRIELLRYFGEEYHPDNCGMCDNCLTDDKNEVDITIPAYKVLSCVKRTGEQFGASHISDVLLGKKSAKVISHKHQELSTFGIGKELQRAQWMDIARQLVRKELLIQDSQYASLKLSPKAYEVLKNKEVVHGVLTRAESANQHKRIKGEIEYNQDLFDRLRQKRKELADAGHVPPYVVFSDQALVEMSAYFPMRVESFLNINGVGQVKAERYSAIFLEVIRNFCQEQGMSEVEKPAKELPSAHRQEDELGKSLLVAGAFQDGQSVGELMKRFAVSQDTIIEHLLRFTQAGNKLRRCDDLLELSTISADQQNLVLAAFTEYGTERLKPVYDAVGGTVIYDELKLLRVYFGSL